MSHFNPSMTPAEKSATLMLASIFGFRMFGLFMILPVFALYANTLTGVTPLLIGIAMGAYGLTQALFQIPFGMLSDKFGRKPLIIIGLIIFIIGSIVAANADSIMGIIMGRLLQGAGAISAVIMALLADLTREEHRTKAMGTIGASIGLTFSIALISGPILEQWIGVKGLFWLTAVLAMLGIIMMLFFIPTPRISKHHRDTNVTTNRFKEILTNTALLRLDFSIFSLHLTLTSLFLAFPHTLLNSLHLPTSSHWKIYLPVILCSLVIMIPFIIIAETKQRIKSVMLFAIGLLMIAEIGIYFTQTHLYLISFCLFLFFLGFNILEASLPSLISKMSPADNKGTAMGVYATSQFSGAFVGGLLGGVVYQHYGTANVFLFTVLIAIIWFIVVLKLPQPPMATSLIINLKKSLTLNKNNLSEQLSNIQGVEEAVVIAGENLAYLKINRKNLDFEKLSAYCANKSDIISTQN